jgi:hypothetical protein
VRWAWRCVWWLTLWTLFWCLLTLRWQFKFKCCHRMPQASSESRILHGLGRYEYRDGNLGELLSGVSCSGLKMLVAKEISCFQGIWQTCACNSASLSYAFCWVFRLQKRCRNIDRDTGIPPGLVRKT